MAIIQEFPNPAVCLVAAHFDGVGDARGSGFIIGPHTIVTAAHVLWNADRGESATTIGVRPGYFNGGPTVSGEYAIHFMHIDDRGGLIAQTETASDFAVIDVAEDLSAYGAFTPSTAEFTTLNVHLSAYPVSAGTAQIDVSGQVRSGFGGLTYDSLTVSPGESGGPLWTLEDGAAYGLVSTASNAMKFTATVLTTIAGWQATDAYLWSSSSPGTYACGGATNDVVKGGSGADLLFGLAGNDYLASGDGADSVLGGDGNDTIQSGVGDSLLYGEAGDDAILWRGGDVFAAGGEGNDSVWAGSGRAYEMGENGDDFLVGGGSNDTLVGGAGDDDLRGGLGTDALFAGLGHDYLTGGGGRDYFYVFDQGLVTNDVKFILDLDYGAVPDAIVLPGAAADALVFAQNGVTWIAAPTADGFDYVGVVGVADPGVVRAAMTFV